MRHHPVVTKSDSDTSGETIKNGHDSRATPTEMEQRRQGAKMHQHHENKILPVDVTGAEAGRIEESGFQVRLV
ncbi:MAG: hypothetical protein ACKO9Z_12080 [Planctomycetota bacterium]